ncbi:hypothetical protein Moror_5654 [Moniliophthora roreri MCA 2997]|uniref:Uncharacterized protein n=1 Tax=Moniliophthora roreri (strain MCA 2997) TaxID=1381753 RepID=V2WMG7_MONRO|nr:hypothetical protein Moror_5654 [Moniliophthora roreri MCA 2997]
MLSSQEQTIFAGIKSIFNKAGRRRDTDQTSGWSRSIKDESMTGQARSQDLEMMLADFSGDGGGVPTSEDVCGMGC